MEILVNLDVMMAKRKISATELAQRIDITPANLSILKNNKGQGHPLFHPDGSVPRIAVPARGHPGICGRHGVKHGREELECQGAFGL